MQIILVLVHCLRSVTKWSCSYMYNVCWCVMHGLWMSACVLHGVTCCFYYNCCCRPREVSLLQSKLSLSSHTCYSKDRLYLVSLVFFSLNCCIHLSALWSVWRMNGLPSRYTSKTFIARTTARHSFHQQSNFSPYPEASGWSRQLGLSSSSWLWTAPTPTLEASVCNTNVWAGSGFFMKVADTRAFFKVLKPRSASGVQTTLSGLLFLISSVSGTAW